MLAAAGFNLISLAPYITIDTALQAYFSSVIRDDPQARASAVTALQHILTLLYYQDIRALFQEDLWEVLAVVVIVTAESCRCRGRLMHHSFSAKAWGKSIAPIEKLKCSVKQFISTGISRGIPSQALERGVMMILSMFHPDQTSHAEFRGEKGMSTIS